MRSIFISVGLLCCSNIFMTFAWYGHLKNLSTKPWIIAALVSWGIALFEYLLQVPANRIGFQVMNLGQLKIIQEVITLLVFVPFSVFFMKEEMRLDFLWAGLCILGAVFFIFRQKIFGA
ncbi:MAG: DMT family protein [Desulfuromonadales bacterium]|nr:DMT family protein [Desulfuromonadales bacterium]